MSDKQKILAAVNAVALGLTLANRMIEAAADLRTLFAGLNYDDSAVDEELDTAMAALDEELARGRKIRGETT